MNWPRRFPRSTGALAFGIAGALAPAAWFLPGIVGTQDRVALVLYVGLPGAVAAAAGAIVGARILDEQHVRTPGRAALRGAAVAGIAILLFAPLFAALFTWPAPGRTSILGLTAFVLFFGTIAGIWAVAVGIGAMIGLLLFRLGTRPHPVDSAR